MDTKEICRQALLTEASLSSEIQNQIDSITNVEWRNFDQSYLEFLDEQISLGARGPEWTERLKIRRDAFSKFSDREHLSCQLETDGLVWDFRVLPDTCEVFHYEFYSYGTEKNG